MFENDTVKLGSKLKFKNSWKFKISYFKLLKANVIKINPCLVVSFNVVSTKEPIITFQVLVNQPLFFVV